MSPTNHMNLSAAMNASDLHRAAAGIPAAKFKQQPHQAIPEPPKRLRSAFIIFSADKHKEIRAGLVAKGISEKVSHLLTD
jgi:hypothetical protein